MCNISEISSKTRCWRSESRALIRLSDGRGLFGRPQFRISSRKEMGPDDVAGGRIFEDRKINGTACVEQIIERVSNSPDFSLQKKKMAPMS